MPLAGRRLAPPGLVGVEGAQLVGPHAAGVDHGRGLDLGAVVESGAAHPLALVGAEGDDGGVVGGDGAVTGYRRAGDGQRQPGVVRPRVPVAEPGDQPPGVEGREVGQSLRAAQAPMALTDAQAAGEVVKPQGGGVGAGRRPGGSTPSLPKSGIRKGRRVTR